MKSKQLESYLDDQLKPHESRQLEQHLSECLLCRQQWESYMEELDDFDHWPEEVSTTDPFTSDIMKQLAPLQPKRDASLRPRTGMRNQASFPMKKKHTNWKKRSLDIMKKSMIAVAGLTVVISLGTFVSPTFAEYVQSLFKSEDSDKGMSHAVDQGFVQKPDQKSTDQGIAFAAKEVLADTMRIAVIIEAVDQAGKQLDLNTGPHVSNLGFRLVDKAGKDIFPDGVDNFHMEKNGDYMMLVYDLNQLAEKGITLPDDVVIVLEHKELNGKKGKWHLEIPVDMAKAKAASVTADINKTYTSPEGVQISLKKMEFAPSASRLTLDTSLTEEARKRIEKTVKEIGLEKKDGKSSFAEFIGYELGQAGTAYQLINEKQEVVAAWDELLGYKDLSIDKKMINAHIFEPLNNSEKLTFKLYAIYLNEFADFKAELDAASLATKPFTAKDLLGGTFTFQELEKEKEADGSYTYRIKVDAKLAKGIVAAEYWSVVGQDGKRTEITFEKDRAVWGEDGRVTVSGVLKIRKVTGDPQKITVSYGIMQKQIRNVQFEVPIKQ
ncbi:DUF4179 domain-containing protein [Brevibacillus borstelensis]|uniref:DUF4179 domain-containing protein n=1 Tax=Brevibacillus borstelensis TaxID=45462 RepID=UPI0030BEF768